MRRVVAATVFGLFEDLCRDHRAVFAGVDRDEARRPSKRLAHDGDTNLLVLVLGL
jgi:hypothetical protein